MEGVAWIMGRGNSKTDLILRQRKLAAAAWRSLPGNVPQGSRRRIPGVDSAAPGPERDLECKRNPSSRSSYSRVRGPSRVPAAAMTRVKTVRRRLARANGLLKIRTRKQNKFGVEAEKLVLTLEGKHGAWSLIMPGAPRRKLVMAKSVTRKQKRSKYSVRLGAAANVIEAYLELPECVREVFRRFLAFYCEGGMYSHLPSTDDGGDSPQQGWTEEHSRLDLYERWIDWARGIQESSLTYYERREAVRMMLEVLRQLKDPCCFTAPELRSVAKKTINWTRWDTSDSSELRSFGFRTEADLKAGKAKLRAKIRKARRRIVDEKRARALKGSKRRRRS